MSSKLAFAGEGAAARSEGLGAPRRVLIYRLGSLGDTVVALPCFHLIERCFPHAERRVLTNVPVSSKAAPLEAILKDGGLIHGVIEYPVSLGSLQAALKLRRSIVTYGPDLLIYLAASRGPSAFPVWRDLLFFRLCGVRRIVGAPLTRDLRLPRRDPEDGELEQEGRRLARAMKALGVVDVADPAMRDLRLTPVERARAAAELEALGGAPFIAVNAGGKDPSKDWGEARWASLLDRLGRDLSGHALVIVGAPDDQSRAARMIAAWPGRNGLSLCGKLSPRQSAAALAEAALFVGHDSGPLHLAAAAGVPCLGLFGASNLPRSWHPEGSSVSILHDMNGVQAITVEKTLTEVFKLKKRATS